MAGAFILMILLVVGIFGGLGWIIYDSVKASRNCEAKLGLYHNGVCYKISGIL